MSNFISKHLALSIGFTLESYFFIPLLCCIRIEIFQLFGLPLFSSSLLKLFSLLCTCSGTSAALVTVTVVLIPSFHWKQYQWVLQSYLAYINIIIRGVHSVTRSTLQIVLCTVKVGEMKNNIIIATYRRKYKQKIKVLCK